MNLIDAVKIIRKELTIKDEPLKGFRLLEALNIPELEDLKHKSYMMVRHYFKPEEHVKAYDIPVPDAVYIEPEQVIDNPGARYARYGWIVDELEVNKPKTYIDLGCYVGSLPCYAATKGIISTGVDLTRGSLDVAKQRALKRGLDVNFVQHDVTTFNEGKYDMVSSFEVFEHVINPQQYIHHLASLTNAGGWVYITTPDGPFGNGEGNLNMKGGWEWKEGDGCRGHLYCFNKKIMQELLKDYEIGRLTSEPDGLIWIKYRKPYEPQN